MTTTIDRLLLVSSASFADGKKRMQQNPPRRRFSLCSPLSNYAFPARLIQNLMKLDESPGSTSLVHLSPPVAAAYHICPSVKGRRLDRPDVSRRMRIEGRRGGSNDDRPAAHARGVEVLDHALRRRLAVDSLLKVSVLVHVTSTTSGSADKDHDVNHSSHVLLRATSNEKQEAQLLLKNSRSYLFNSFKRTSPCF